MPSRNIDIVRSIYAAWERGNHSVAEWADPEIECVFADGPYPARWTGLAHTDEGMRSFLSAWEEYRIEPIEYRTLDEERVLVSVRAYGRGESSGVELADNTRGRGGANLFHVRDGKVVRLDAYFDLEHALADLGLTG